MSLSVLFVLLSHFAGFLSAYDATVCGTNGYSAPSGSFACESWPALGHPPSLSSCLLTTRLGSLTNTDSANAWNAARRWLPVHLGKTRTPPLSIRSSLTRDQINNSQPAFDARWRWPTNTTSVHSFPYVSFVDGSLPAVLSNISALQLTSRWGMASGSASRSTTGSVLADQLDTSGLIAQATKANVALDMFLHLNASKANAATTASTEIMIWLATVGGAKALGYAKNRTCFAQKLGSVD